MTKLNFPNINTLWSSLIIEELVRNEVDYFCIAPGSRSAPLTMAVANHPKIKNIIHFDERGLGFHALGYISATKKTCVIITTSGTAVANLLPAIIEISKKKLPLIILTADRPPELRFTGAHQTIDQVKIFNNYVKWQFDFPCPTMDIAPEFILTTIDQTVAQSNGNPSGPVHLNCMFREPLAPIKEKVSFIHYLKSLTNWQKTAAPYTTYALPTKTLTPDNAQFAIKQINSIKKGIIIVGKISSDEERQSILKLSEKLNWPLFPDISSGLRLGCTHKNSIPYFDQILLDNRPQYKPNGILHLGGRITSKKWYQFIENTKPKNYIMVLNHPLRNDPLHNVSLRIETSVFDFCKTVNKKLTLNKNKSFLTLWQKANQQTEKNIINTLDAQYELTESCVARLITQYIPKNVGLFLSNSMTIREMDRFASPQNNSVIVGGNRGASGIDGIIASAIGFATGLNKPTTLLIGDLAFLHDLNSLAMLSNLKQPLIIVLINNNGGKIFSHLPIAHSNPHFKKYFQTPHYLTFHAAADLFNLNYVQPEARKEFVKAYKTACQSQSSTLIELTL